MDGVKSAQGACSVNCDDVLLLDLAPLVQEDGDTVAELVVWNSVEKTDQIIIDERKVCVWGDVGKVGLKGVPYLWCCKIARPLRPCLFEDCIECNGHCLKEACQCTVAVADNCTSLLPVFLALQEGESAW